MQVYLLALLLGLFAYSASGDAHGENAHHLSSGALAAWYFAPKLALAALYWLLCVWTQRRLGRGDATRLMRRFDRATWLYRVLCLKDYALDLWWLGALDLVRQTVGDMIVVDELAVLLPPLVLAVWSWWAYYPIDRRMRQSTLIARLDAGLPVHPIWTRGQFLASQLRHQVAMVMGPMLLILAWEEAVWRWLPEAIPGIGSWVGGVTINPRPLAALAGVAFVIMLAPELIRRVWDTAPIPPGDMRQMLMSLCKRHRVRVRELLLWRTFGGMTNAAVMGFIAPFRYILLTDALLESMPQRQVEAVMAHELAHVRKHHMPWLLATAAAAWGVLAVIWAVTIEHGLARWWPGVLSRLKSMFDLAHGSVEEFPTLVAGLGAGVCWVFVFGWVSRRFERQADTFAVQHMTTQRGEIGATDHGNERATPVIIDSESAEVMIAALQRVADLNHIPTPRRSWRHGSIAWRQAYLRTLAGTPLMRPPVDRVIRRIHVATVIALILLAALWAWEMRVFARV